MAELLPDKHPQKKLLLAYQAAYEKHFGEEREHVRRTRLRRLHALRPRRWSGSAPTARRSGRAIETTRGFVGTAGVFNFSAADHNGLGLDAFEMLTVKDGRFVPLAL